MAWGLALDMEARISCSHRLAASKCVRISGKLDRKWSRQNSNVHSNTAYWHPT